MDAPPARRRSRRLLLALGVLLSIAALGQVVSKARKGRQALIKWGPDIEGVARGENVYHRSAPGERSEGYPTLPLSLLLLKPFHALGPVPGSAFFGCVKLALAWFIVLSALGLAAGRAGDFPPWAAAAVVFLSARVLLSDMAHGNLNIVVGATLVASALSWQRGRETAAGFWAGAGAVLKVTPAIALVYFLWKRSLRAWIGFGMAVGLLAFAAPGLVFGFGFNLELVGAWWNQMIAPAIGSFEGAPLRAMQTEQLNQSLTGVTARLLTDSVAIEASPPKFDADVRINVAELGPGAQRGVLAVLALGLTAFLLRSVSRQRGDRRGPVVLAEYGLLALLALFLSERSWKHHYVLLPLPLAFLLWELAHGRRDRAWWMAAAGVVTSALLHGATGSAFLGGRGSDLAEAYGAYLFGGLALFAAVGAVLRRRYGRSAVRARG